MKNFNIMSLITIILCTVSTELCASDTSSYIQNITNYWSQLSPEVQNRLIGASAAAAIGIYGTPRLYQYFMSPLEARKNAIIDAVNKDEASDFPLNNFQREIYPNEIHKFNAIVNSFDYYHQRPLSDATLQHKRGELLFFRYLQTYIKDLTYQLHDMIKREILIRRNMPKSSFIQRWITGRSDDLYARLNKLKEFNDELTNIIAQLENELIAELSYGT